MLISYAFAKVKTILDTPVPKVLSWSADSSGPNNPVESEYLIMEQAQGIEVGRNWAKIPLESKSAMVKDLVSIQEKLLTVHFQW